MHKSSTKLVSSADQGSENEETDEDVSFVKILNIDRMRRTTWTLCRCQCSQ